MTKGKERDSWIQALKRENPNRTKWNSKRSDRICALHFVDGLPTKVNPLPTMHKGYDTKDKIIDALYPQRKHEQRKVKLKLESLIIKLIKLS